MRQAIPTDDIDREMAAIKPVGRGRVLARILGAISQKKSETTRPRLLSSAAPQSSPIRVGPTATMSRLHAPITGCAMRSPRVPAAEPQAVGSFEMVPLRLRLARRQPSRVRTLGRESPSQRAALLKCRERLHEADGTGTIDVLLPTCPSRPKDGIENVEAERARPTYCDAVG